jgi:hypothetical protein
MASDNVLLAAQDPARLTVGEEILNIELQPDNDDSDVMIHVHSSPICLIIRSATLRRSTLWCHCHPFRQCQPTHPPTSHTPSFPHTNTYTLSPSGASVTPLTHAGILSATNSCTTHPPCRTPTHTHRASPHCVRLRNMQPHVSHTQRLPCRQHKNSVTKQTFQHTWRLSDSQAMSTPLRSRQPCHHLPHMLLLHL